MNPKSGNPGSASGPSDPSVATDADNADPGKVAEIKREQRETESGKYGSEQVEAYKPPAPGEEPEDPSWIEIELVDEDDEPVPFERYEVTLPDGRVTRGSLDENGFIRIEPIPAGECKITFPELPGQTWDWA